MFTLARLVSEGQEEMTHVKTGHLRRERSGISPIRVFALVAERQEVERRTGASFCKGQIKDDTTSALLRRWDLPRGWRPEILNLVFIHTRPSKIPLSHSRLSQVEERRFTYSLPWPT